MSANSITFCSLINQEVFKSGDLSDLARADLEAYFKAIKQRFDSGEQFPFDLEELVSTVFALKHKAVEAIERGFNQGTDFVIFIRSGENSQCRSIIEYRLSPKTFEFNERLLAPVARLAWNASLRLLRESPQRDEP